MRIPSHLDAVTVLAALCGALVVGGCQKETSPPAPKTVSTDVTPQTTTPSPPGDITPKPADENHATPNPATEAASRSGNSQSTVGSAASGAPPYTLQSAPEGNKAPRNGDVKK